jgi:hypothetical protein
LIASTAAQTVASTHPRCTVLFRTVLFRTVLFRTVLFRTLLFRTVLFRTLLFCTVLVAGGWFMGLLLAV